MASADSLDIVAGSTSWQSFQTPSTSGGTAFWNHASYDDNGQCNIGYWLSGTGGCGANGGTFLASSPRVTPDYLGDASTGFKFSKAADTTSVTVTNRLEVTAYRDDERGGLVRHRDPGRSESAVRRCRPRWQQRHVRAVRLIRLLPEVARWHFSVHGSRGLSHPFCGVPADRRQSILLRARRHDGEFGRRLQRHGVRRAGVECARTGVDDSAWKRTRGDRRRSSSPQGPVVWSHARHAITGRRRPPGETLPLRPPRSNLRARIPLWFGSSARTLHSGHSLRSPRNQPARRSHASEPPDSDRPGQLDLESFVSFEADFIRQQLRVPKATTSQHTVFQILTGYHRRQEEGTRGGTNLAIGLIDTVV